MRDQLQIRTIWKTASEQCEVGWDRFMTCRTRLWVSGHLTIDEVAADIGAAIDRALELRTQRPAMVK